MPDPLSVSVFLFKINTYPETEKKSLYGLLVKIVTYKLFKSQTRAHLFAQSLQYNIDISLCIHCFKYYYLTLYNSVKY